MIFDNWRKKRFEKQMKIFGFGDINTTIMICEKCSKPCGPGTNRPSFSPIGEGKVRCSNCWDWL